jgi:two-component system OmpR family sensor kinase
VIAALAGISVAGAFVFRDYLHANADRQVTLLSRQAQGGLLHQINGTAAPLNEFGPYLEAFVPTGHELGPAQSQQLSPPDIPTSASWLNANAGKLVTVPAISGGDQWRVLVRPVDLPTFNGQTLAGTLIAAEDLGNLNQTVGRLVSIDLIVGVIVVLGLAVVGVAVVRASLQPLAEIEQTAGEIAAGDLTRRVAEHDARTEVGRLGQSLNAMLAQIEAAFRAQAQSEATARWSEGRMRQFAADASHELRTPLTAIKGYAEYYRQRGGVTANGNGELAPEDLDRIMHRVEDEATRMGLLVEDLLLLARIDQQRPLDRRPVDVLALAADAVQDARMIAPDREVRLTVGHDTAFLVIGDEARLRQVVGNLMNNALTHTPGGTPIEVHVRSGTLGGWMPPGPGGTGAPGGSGGAAAHQPAPAVILEVVDHGPGLTKDQADRVFERFYRADQARTRKTGGTGLGLAIVSALVKAHDGRVSIDTESGQGATFRVALPLAPEAQGPGWADPDGHDEDLAAQPGQGGTDQTWPAQQTGPAGQPEPWNPAHGWTPEQPTAEQAGPPGAGPVGGQASPPAADLSADDSPAGDSLSGDPSAGGSLSGGAADVVEQRRWRLFS